MNGNDRLNQVFALTPRPVYEHGYPAAGPVPVPAAGTPVPHPESAIPTLRMRPNFRSWLRYNRETSATTFSPRKTVPSYDRRPASSQPSCPPSRHSTDTKSVPGCDQTFVAVSDTTVRPMRPLSATKNFSTATILVSSATNSAPSQPCLPQLRNVHECDHPSVAGSDTTVRPVRPRPPRQSPPTARCLYTCIPEYSHQRLRYLQE